MPQLGIDSATLQSILLGLILIAFSLQGLMDAEERHGFEGDGYVYLRSPIWWAGISTRMTLSLLGHRVFEVVLLTNSHAVVIGEICNFAAYAFAPAILVTPLGALSVLIGAVLGSYFLNERLGTLGKLGSAICLIGSVIIVLHAPPDEDIKTVDRILKYALQPGMKSRLDSRKPKGVANWKQVSSYIALAC